MKIDGYWNLAFFAFILIFGLGMASLGAKKSPSLLGYNTTTPTPFRLPTLPPGAPTPTITPGGPTLTPNPNTPTNTPVPPTATTAPVPPTATPNPTSTPQGCPASSAQTYGTITGINGGAIGGIANMATNPEINLAIRGYIWASQSLNLVNYGGGTAPAPQLSTLLNPSGSVPTFLNTYQVYNWNYTTNSRGTPVGSLPPPQEYPVTLAGIQSAPGSVVYVPNFSGNIIDGIYTALVLYADATRVTLNYSRNNVVSGAINSYTIHIEGFCTDPNLLSLYLATPNLNTLPAVRGQQPIGTANSNEVKVAIRDSGQFMDPRSRKDWWVGF